MSAHVGVLTLTMQERFRQHSHLLEHQILEEDNSSRASVQEYHQEENSYRQVFVRDLFLGGILQG